MATILLPRDFNEFLKLLNSYEVRYLIVGGYAVNFHGYPRATGDIDVWIDRTAENAERTARAVREFGFREVEPELFLQPAKVIRMGQPPLRVEILTSISGVEFSNCFENRSVADLGGTTASFIGAEDLRTNKKASGRLKDLADLEQLR